MAEKKYKVCPGVALTTKGVIFNEGDEIPAGTLTEESVKALLAAKKIADADAAPAAEKKASGKAKEEKK